MFKILTGLRTFTVQYNTTKYFSWYTQKHLGWRQKNWALKFNIFQLFWRGFLFVALSENTVNVPKPNWIGSWTFDFWPSSRWFVIPEIQTILFGFQTLRWSTRPTECSDEMKAPNCNKTKPPKKGAGLTLGGVCVRTWLKKFGNSRLRSYPSSNIDVEVSSVGTDCHSNDVTLKVNHFFRTSKTGRRFQAIKCHPVGKKDDFVRS